MLGSGQDLTYSKLINSLYVSLDIFAVSEPISPQQTSYSLENDNYSSILTIVSHLPRDLFFSEAPSLPLQNLPFNNVLTETNILAIYKV